MRRVFKYPLKAANWQLIHMPKKAEILTIKVQNDSPCLWALVDSTNSMVERIIRVYATGEPIADDRQSYIDTFMLNNGELVFHVFEEIV